MQADRVDSTVAPAGTRYLALYCRLSKAAGGQLESVERQERWGRKYAAEHPQLQDLPIRVFADNDLSAFDDNTIRPEYEALRAELRAGHVGAIWAVEQTRIEANRRRWVELVAELDDAGIDVLHTNRDGLVRLDEVADIKHILAWHERKRLRERINDTLGDLAAEGRPPPGHPFGYRRVKVDGVKTLEPVPELAAAARWAASAALSGWSRARIAEELKRRQVPTVLGGQWNEGRVKGMLTSPTIAGLRVHQGKVVRRGNWEPILDETTWRQLCARFATQHEVVRVDGAVRQVAFRNRGGRRYLLSGIFICGRCGHHLTGRTDRRHKRRSQSFYFCAPPYGCGRSHVVAEPVDELVVAQLFERLDRPEFAAAMAADEHAAQREALVAELNQIEAKHIVLGERWAEGKLPDVAWDAARAKLDDRKVKVEAALADLPAPAADLDPEAIKADWETMTLDERRQIIRLLLRKVTILPAKPGTKRFDPARVLIAEEDWRI